MAYRKVDEASLTEVADAIRAKSGTMDKMEFPGGFVSTVQAIQTGGGDVNESEDGFISRSATSYTNTRVSSVGSNCAYKYISLTSIYLPAATNIGYNAFYGCSGLTDVNLPAATTITQYAFSGCTGLTDVNLPAATTIGQYAFNGCNNLKCVDLSGSAKPIINTYAFQNCSKLNAVIIRSDTVATLSGTNALTGTLIAQGLGGIYVPDDLVDTYKAATNWATYAANIYPISAYPVTDFSTIHDSWDEVLAAINDGTYATKYSVGDTKLMTINGSDVYVQLVAMDADPLTDGSGNTAPTSWLVKSILTTHVMNSTGTNANGWAACEMRSWLRETAITWLPETIRSAIKEVTKTYYDYTAKSTLSIADTVWIPSYREVFGGTSYETSGPDYTAVYSSSATRIRYNLSGAAVVWWLRSADSSVSSIFRCVGFYGDNNSGNAISSYGVLLGFCL